MRVCREADASLSGAGAFGMAPDGSASHGTDSALCPRAFRHDRAASEVQP